MLKTLVWLSQQLLPPAFLSYFYFSWKICTFEVGPWFLAEDKPLLGAAYTILPSILIAPITTFYLRLYFLNPSRPPFDCPAVIINKKTPFACLSADEASEIRSKEGWEDEEVERSREEPMVERCYKGKCRGAWKPARARHCSQCGVCRMGFDHHCPFFANCLTAPYVPAFLALLLYTPPTTILLSLPLYPLLLRRASAAYHFACVSDSIKGWWDWPWSWIVAGGPVGRWVGGVVLGWMQLDQMSVGGPGIERLGVGVMVVVGIVLALITSGLAYSTLQTIKKGDLTIDTERRKSYHIARRAASGHYTLFPSEPLPQHIADDLKRFGGPAFYIPNTESEGEGHIVQPKLEMELYDFGETRNWELVMGSKGWGWLLPWRALGKSMPDGQVMQWPIEEEARRKLGQM
ncbi:hypothetical protein B9479_002232 [Cryptococcus floricola]|uniref:Palmitoyltransferase n=1 Tax=Cryptococcus floricola TaxID=2591691 RepID=A0A5D3B3N4_9TREE|nr:hypothetical protein B9479_002232 [Cryptococcus floricola]